MMSDPSCSIPVRWPDAFAVLGDEYAREWPRRVKYALRRWLTTSGRRAVLAHVARSPTAPLLLVHAPRVFYPVMHKHLDRRFDARQRATAMVATMAGLERALGADRAARVFSGHPLTLATLPDGTRVTLNLNRLTFHEGLWAIDLTRADGLRLFTISFGWQDDATLMIGCVQGPPRQVDGLACVRELTEVSHGLRPGHLLMFVLRECAQAWGVERMVGVDEAHQVKGRWNHQAVARCFDYDAFWTETSGTRLADGNWGLPVVVPQRPIDDVPSKRRAMYRRRYAWLETLVQSARHALGGDPSPPFVDSSPAPRPLA